MAETAGSGREKAGVHPRTVARYMATGPDELEADSDDGLQITTVGNRWTAILTATSELLLRHARASHRGRRGSRDR